MKDVTTTAKSFRGTLERGTWNLGWTIIRIPFDAAKLWGTRGQIRVKGEINGFPFRTSLFATGTGEHVMLVNKKMQAGGKVKLGGTAQFRLEPDTEERVVEVPPELEAILAEDRALRRWYDQLNHSTRYEIGRSIAGVKSAEARARRAEQMAERILSVMDAERELPPALKIAFVNDPIAHEGWKSMSPTQRRGQLLAIFYYRDPQSRARRTAKVLAEARKRVTKK
jgi:uncharacterized protein YdeI (YjbR/CyaY-like superfamily)